MSLQVHIERLVLEGLPLEARHGAAFQQALEAELGRLLGERGLAPGLASGAALPKLGAEPLQLGARPAAAPLGRQAAQSLAGALGAPEPKRSSR